MRLKNVWLIIRLAIIIKKEKLLRGARLAACTCNEPTNIT